MSNKIEGQLYVSTVFANLDHLDHTLKVLPKDQKKYLADRCNTENLDLIKHHLWTFEIKNPIRHAIQNLIKDHDLKYKDLSDEQIYDNIIKELQDISKEQIQAVLDKLVKESKLMNRNIPGSSELTFKDLDQELRRMPNQYWLPFLESRFGRLNFTRPAVQNDPMKETFYKYVVAKSTPYAPEEKLPRTIFGSNGLNEALDSLVEDMHKTKKEELQLYGYNLIRKKLFPSFSPLEQKMILDNYNMGSIERPSKGFFGGILRRLGEEKISRENLKKVFENIIKEFPPSRVALLKKQLIEEETAAQGNKDVSLSENTTKKLKKT